MEYKVTSLMKEAQAADFLGIKKNTLACWRSSRLVNLPYIKIGGSVRYKLKDLEQYLEANKHGHSN
jgi:predicted site-specific integrase-resolvase